MRKKLFSLFAALTLSVGLWAEGSVFTYTATMKLAPYFNFLGDVASHEFNEQTGAGTVTYSNTVTEIGAFAFNECSPLQSITIPASVTTIGTSAFTLCSSLQSITIPASVTTIGQGAFSTSGLTSITLPAGVTTIDLSTFYNCSSLESVTIPAGVTTIGDNAFTFCSSLQTITIPAGVATIGWSAFYGCTGLTSVTFEGTACQDAIGDQAFNNVGKTTPATLVLPNDWTGSKPDKDGWWYGGYFNVSAPAPEEGDQFKDATSGLNFEVTATGETNTVKVITNGLATPYSGTTYTVPDTVNYNGVDFAVTELGENAFSECSSLQSITLPEGLLTIGEGVFILCSSLQSIAIPSSVTEIGKMAFNVCPALQSITLSEGLLTIGQQAFGSCTSLQSITFPASVTEIGRVAFYGCTGLTSVTFLGNACQDAIGDIVFEGVGEDAPAALTLPTDWTGIRPDQDGLWYGGYFNVSAPAPVEGETFVDETSGLKFEVTAVGEANTVKVIKNNYSDATYTVPDTVNYNNVDFAVTEIGEDAFSECSSLEFVTIPASVTTIGEDAFSECSSLEFVTLSEGLLTIGEYAFFNCVSLQTITIPASVTTIGEDAFSISGLTSITIPASVTEIGEEAFSWCESLQSVTLSEGLLTIGDGAFSACPSLTSITIPASVTEIGLGAFIECTGLTSVTFLGNACQNNIGEMAFNGVGSTETPSALTLPTDWTGIRPDQDGLWYGGYFKLGATALPIIDSEFKIQNSKLIINGQLILRSSEKTYTILGQGL